MLNIGNFHRIIQRGDAPKLLDFFKSYKQQVHDYLIECIRSEPQTTYREYILNHADGQKRARVYINCFEAALSGNIEAFLEDQRQIGYVRAMEGYHLNDVYGYTVAFKDALWRASREYNAAKQDPAECLNNDDLFTLYKLLDGAYYLLSVSFLETRDEIIMRHRDQLQALQGFAARVVSIFDEEKIWTQATQGIFDIFGLSGTLFLFEPEDSDQKLSLPTRMIGDQVVQQNMKIVLEKIRHFLVPVAMDNRNSLLYLSESMDTDSYLIVASPIKDRKNKLKAVITVHDQGRPFRFLKFDRNLLYQFSYFTGAVSANSRMVSEIAHKQADLRNLTKRLISVQEEERKKIAADIHDVLTQALTGIGYKALYCIEVAEKDLARLKKELEQLVETINEALRQSRQIISNLRPHILDDIGVVAACRKLVGDFGEKSAIDTQFIYSEPCQVHPEKGIALFRILQEALHNVRRHAEATKVDVSLCIEDNSFFVLTVKDNGKGFDLNQLSRPRLRTGLGLLTMRERAEDLGGRFGVDSRPGGGSTVTVWVPLEEDADSR